jgi:polysaccharide biosynthesis transport protein
MTFSRSSNFAQSAEDEGGLQLAQVGAALQRYWLVIVGTTVAFAALAQIKSVSDSPNYGGTFEILTKSVTAEAEVISSISDTLSRDRQRQEPQTDQKVLDATKIKVLRSPSLLYPVVNELQRQYPHITYQKLFDSLAIQTSVQDILTVTYESSNPQEVEDVLKVVSAAYLNYSLEERQRDIRQGMSFVEKQLPALETRVKSQQGKLQSFRQRYNLIDPEVQGRQLSEQAGDIAKQRLSTTTALDEAQLLYQELNQQLSQQSPEFAGSSALSENKRYQDLLARLAEVESKLAQDSAIYLDGSPEIQMLQDQRQNLRPLLIQEAQRVQQQVASRIQELQNRGQALSQSQGLVNLQIRQLSAIARDYTEIQRELQIATDNLNQFLAKREGLQLDAAQRQVPWLLLTPPGEPQQKSPGMARNLAMGAGLGLLLGTGLALALNTVSDAIHTSKELKQATKLPLLGVIPQHKSLSNDAHAYELVWNQAGIADTDMRSDRTVLFLESFRSLFANIQLMKMDQPIRAIAISSAVPSQGKTTTAVHLAQAAASMGKRVLLVDGDLRRPQLHRRLGLENTTGLADVVSNSLHAFSAVQQVAWNPNLYVMTAGSPADPTQILSAQAMQDFMEASQADFDLVIYDTPPLLGFADAYLLSPYIDGILFVGKLHELKRPLLEQAMENLKLASAPLLGIVANGSTERSVSTRGYYKYYARRDEETEVAIARNNLSRVLSPLQGRRKKVRK